jgi:DNA-binding transcriptional ArsR family regulator
MTAGGLADEFELSRPTMSGHFAVLRAADLVVAEKHGTTITYTLRLSVLQDALLGFAEVFGVDEAPVDLDVHGGQESVHAT